MGAAKKEFLNSLHYVLLSAFVPLTCGVTDGRRHGRVGTALISREEAARSGGH